MGTSALIVLNLKELGVPQVVGKARSAVHHRVLEKIGADRVVFPEQEMALRLPGTWPTGTSSTLSSCRRSTPSWSAAVPASGRGRASGNWTCGPDTA